MKLEWVKKRLIEICLGVENVALWDNLQSDFIDKVKECSQKFPATNFGAFVKIVNQTCKVKPTLEEIVGQVKREDIMQVKQVIEKPTLVLTPS